MRPSAVHVTAIRRLAIAAQGYAARGRRGTTAEVEATVRRLSCVQLDSISTVERSHRIALGSRIGAHPKESVSRLLGGGRLIEYWAHEACLLPADDWPLFRPAMQVALAVLVALMLVAAVVARQLPPMPSAAEGAPTH